MTDGYSCYHILGFIAMLSLYFFPWPFLPRQWCWADRDGNHFPSVPRGVMAVAVVAVGRGWIQQSGRGESGAVPCPRFLWHPGWAHIPCTQRAHTYINPGHSGYRHTESTHEHSRHQCWHLEMPVPGVTAPVQLSLQTNLLTQKTLWDPCLSSLLWSWPQRLADPLAPRPCHLLPGWSSSSFTGD